MRKLLAIGSAIALIVSAGTGIAGGHSAADNGKGDGKGRKDVAAGAGPGDGVSAGNNPGAPGDAGNASVASGVERGGWGQVGGVANGPKD